jgi:dTDP-4-dehydrorhamnose reductase
MLNCLIEFNMRILLIGNTGQVGWELERTLAPLGDVVAVDYPEIDLANSTLVRSFVRKVQPEVIVNAAAYTDVDKAEREPELAFAVNGIAPGLLAEEANSIKAALIHYSTDFVFDGNKGISYCEEDTPNPINKYGESKLVGERAVRTVDGAYLILRTSWVYSLFRDCFVTRVLNWAREKKTLRIVTDQVGSPTWSRLLAEATAMVLAQGGPDIVDWIKERKGLYHLAGRGSASRLEWCRAVLENDSHKEEQIAEEILPAISSDFQMLVERPKVSSLNCEYFTKCFGLSLPHWEKTLALALRSVDKK